MDTQENTSSKTKKTSEEKLTSQKTIERTSRKVANIENKDKNQVDTKSPIGKKSSRALSEQPEEGNKKSKRDATKEMDKKDEKIYDTLTPDNSKTPVKFIKDNTEIPKNKIKGALTLNSKNTLPNENKTPTKGMSRKASDAMFENQNDSAVRLLRTQDKKNLYDKLHEELKNYADVTKNEIVFKGNRRFVGKNLDEFLKENPFEMDELYGKAAEEVKRKVSAEEGIEVITQGEVKYIKHKDAASALIDIIKDRQIIKEFNITPKLDGKVVTTFVDKRQNLTPIPTVSSKNIRNAVEREKLSNVERMAVHLRRLEYSNKLVVKASGKLTDAEVIKLVKTIRIQRWWRYMMRRVRATKLIQSWFKGYKLRFRLRRMINIHITRVVKFNLIIRRAISRRFFLLFRIFFFYKRKHILHILMKIFRTRILFIFKFFISRVNLYMESFVKKNSIDAILSISDYINRKVILRHYWKLWKTRFNQYRSKKKALKSFFNVAIGLNYLDNSFKFKQLKSWVFERLNEIRRMTIKRERTRKLIEIKIESYIRITLKFLHRWIAINKLAKLRIIKLISSSLKIEKKHLKILRKAVIRWLIRTTKQKSMSLAFNRVSRTNEFAFLIRIYYLKSYFILLIKKMKRKIQNLKIKDMTLLKIKNIQGTLKKRFDRWYKFAILRKSKEIEVWELRRKVESIEKLLWSIRLYIWKKYFIFNKLRQNTVIVRRHRAAASLDKTYNNAKRKKIIFAFEKLKDHNKVLFYKLRRIIEKQHQKNYIMSRYRIIPNYFKLWRKNGLWMKIEKNARNIKFLSMKLKILFIRRIFFFDRLKMYARLSSAKALFKKRMDTENTLILKRKTKYLNRWKNNTTKNKLSDVKLKILRMCCKKTFKFVIRRSLLNYLKQWKRKVYLIRSEYLAGVGKCKTYIGRFLRRYAEELESLLLSKRAARIVHKYVNIKNFILKKKILQFYFNKWNKKIFINNIKNSRIFARSKILKFIIVKKEKRNLKYFFSLWDKLKKPKISKILNSLQKINEGHLVLKRVWSKKPFVDLAKNMRIKCKLNSFRKRFMNNSNKNKRRMLRLILGRWKLKSKGLRTPKILWKVLSKLWYKNKSQEKLKLRLFDSDLVYQRSRRAFLQDITFIIGVLDKNKSIRLAKIQNAFRYHKQTMEEENNRKKKFCIKTVIENYIKTQKSDIKTIFLKWSRKAKMATVLARLRIITKFIKWNLIPKLKKKKREKFNNFVILLEFYKARNYFGKLKQNYRNRLIFEKFGNKLIEIERYYNDERILIYLKRWRANAEMRKKASLKTVNKIITVTKAWRVSKVLKKDSLMRKMITKLLTGFIKKQQIYFLKWKNFVLSQNHNENAKIIQDFIRDQRKKHLNKEKLKAEKLMKKLIELNVYINKSKMAKLVDHFYVLYIFKIFKKLTFLTNRKFRKNHLNSPFEKLKEIFINDKINKSVFEYPATKGCHKEINPKILTFKSTLKTRLTKIKEKNVKSDKRELYLKILLPNFANYLNDKIFERKQTGFKAVDSCNFKKNKKDKLNKFEDTIKNIFVNNGIKRFQQILKENAAQKKLKILLAKFFVFKLVIFAVEYNHYSRLCNFIKITNEIKEINRRNNILAILRKWWLVVSMKKFQKKKITQLYKKMNLVFLDMVDDMFGDNPDAVPEYVHQIYNIDKIEETISINEKIVTTIEKKREKFLQDSKIETSVSSSSVTPRTSFTSSTPKLTYQSKLPSRKPSVQENNKEKNQGEIPNIPPKRNLERKLTTGRPSIIENNEEKNSGEIPSTTPKRNLERKLTTGRQSINENIDDKNPGEIPSTTPKRNLERKLTTGRQSINENIDDKNPGEIPNIPPKRNLERKLTTGRPSIIENNEEKNQEEIQNIPPKRNLERKLTTGRQSIHENIDDKNQGEISITSPKINLERKLTTSQPSNLENKDEKVQGEIPIISPKRNIERKSTTSQPYLQEINKEKNEGQISITSPTRNLERKLTTSKPSIPDNNEEKNITTPKNNLNNNLPNINDSVNSEEFKLSHNSNKSETKNSVEKEEEIKPSNTQKLYKNDFSKTLNNYNNNNISRNLQRRGTEVNPNLSKPMIEKRNTMRANTLKIQK